MRPTRVWVVAACGAVLAGAAVAVAPVALPEADQTAAFVSAGFKQQRGQWRNCDDPTPTYSQGVIEAVQDANGDGRPEAVIVEGGTYCYGATGLGYWLVSKQTDGSWKLVTSGTGIVTFLATKGAGGWADIEIGGPGFCFPVERWNGKEYRLNRHEYEGKPCKPPS